jgi:hypothetical protein
MADIVMNRAMNEDYKNMSTLNTYCGILSTCHNYKKARVKIKVRFRVKVRIKQ